MAQDHSLAQIPDRFPAVLMDGIVVPMSETMGDLIVHCTIELEGQIDFQRLQKAVRLAIDIEPICGCVYVEGWWRSHWKRRTDLDQVEWCSLQPSDNPHADLNTFLITQIDARKDPLVHIKILRAENDLMCIKVNHVIVDAGGLKEFAYIVASTYNQLGGSPSLKITPNTEGKRHLLQIWHRFSLKDKWGIFKRLLRDLRRIALPPTNWHVPSKSTTTEERTYAFHHITPEEFVQLKSLGRRHNTTVNDVILTAYYRALHTTIQPPPKTPSASSPPLISEDTSPTEKLAPCAISPPSRTHTSALNSARTSWKRSPKSPRSCKMINKTTSGSATSSPSLDSSLSCQMPS